MGDMHIFQNQNNCKYLLGHIIDAKLQLKGVLKTKI